MLMIFCLQLYPRVQTSKKAVEWLSQEQKSSLRHLVMMLSQHTPSCYNIYVFFFLWFWYKREMRRDYESQVESYLQIVLTHRTYAIRQGQMMVGNYKEMFWKEIVYCITVLKVILCPVLYIYIYTHIYTYTYTDILCLVFNMYLITICLHYVMFIKQKARYRYLQKYFKYINMLAVLVTCRDQTSIVNTCA
jgi:hypothetical protein